MTININLTGDIHVHICACPPVFEEAEDDRMEDEVMEETPHTPTPDEIMEETVQAIADAAMEALRECMASEQNGAE